MLSADLRPLKGGISRLSYIYKLQFVEQLRNVCFSLTLSAAAQQLERTQLHSPCTIIPTCASLCLYRKFFVEYFDRKSKVHCHRWIVTVSYGIYSMNSPPPKKKSLPLSGEETFLFKWICYLNESVKSLISIVGDMRSYRILYTASRMGILTW